jgi:hypothetical protein
MGLLPLKRSFDGHQFETRWDNIHLAYFTGEALWNLPERSAGVPEADCPARRDRGFIGHQP